MAPNDESREYQKMKMVIAHLVGMELREGEKIEVYMNFATFRHFHTTREKFKGKFIKTGSGILVRALCNN